ncbi:MAG: transporter [Gammaproteobacteria bacterium]|nr:transporter [Gammaproteobacteria bacterium]
MIKTLELHRHRSLACAMALLVLGLVCRVGFSQELTPRAYWPAPTGTNVFGLGYQYASGDVLTDPSLPIYGVDSTLNAALLTYQRFFDLFDRTATVQVNLPYTWGSTEGTVEGQFLTRDIDAFGDARIRFAINLRGAPAMDPTAFRQMLDNPKIIVGASLTVQAPTGAYQTDRYINAGTNRWSAKPALGVIVPLYPTWLLEGELGVWLFGDNDEFVGVTREQEPIFSGEFHLIKVMKAGIWASLDLNFYEGGQSTVDGVDRDDIQRNSRLGLTLAYPFNNKHLIRTSYSTGIVTEVGSAYGIFSLGYIYAWR